MGWKFACNISTHILHDFISTFSACSSCYSWLDCQNCIRHLFDKSRFVSNVGVRMQSKDFWVLIKRQTVNILSALLKTAVRRSIVDIEL